MEFTAPSPLNGGLLAAEVESATGLPAVDVEYHVSRDTIVVGNVAEKHRSTVEDVVASHDPSGHETEQERANREFRGAVSNASSVADLKDALLGTNSAGRASTAPS